MDPEWMDDVWGGALGQATMVGLVDPTKWALTILIYPMCSTGVVFFMFLHIFPSINKISKYTWNHINLKQNTTLVLVLLVFY